MFIDINNTNQMSLNNFKLNDECEIKTDEDNVVHNLDIILNYIKEEPKEEFIDIEVYDEYISDATVSNHLSSDEFQLKMNYNDKVIKIEKDILNDNVFESEIIIEKNEMHQRLNEEKCNDFNHFELVDLPKLNTNELIYRTNDIKKDIEKLIYFCDFCNQSFNSKKNLTFHIRHHTNILFTNKITKNVCLKVHDGCTNHEQLKKTLFKCEVCEKYFSDQSNCNRHTKIHFRNNVNKYKKVFRCSICGKQFNDQSNCNRHTKIHFQTNKNKFKCHICMKTYSREYNLLVHNRIHSGENPYKCEICQLKFYRNDFLQAHRRRIHGINYIYKQLHLYCDICSKQFYSNTTFMRHKMIHNNEKPYTCNSCQKSYSRKDTLITHLRSKHTGEKPYKCHICKKSFFENNVLVRHMKTHSS